MSIQQPLPWPSFPEGIDLVHAWFYYRFAVRFRDFQARMASRGVLVSYEAVRRWCDKFGHPYAAGRGVLNFAEAAFSERTGERIKEKTKLEAALDELLFGKRNRSDLSYTCLTMDT